MVEHLVVTQVVPGSSPGGGAVLTSTSCEQFVCEVGRVELIQQGSSPGSVRETRRVSRASQNARHSDDVKSLRDFSAHRYCGAVPGGVTFSRKFTARRTWSGDGASAPVTFGRQFPTGQTGPDGRAGGSEMPTNRDGGGRSTEQQRAPRRLGDGPEAEDEGDDQRKAGERCRQCRRRGVGERVEVSVVSHTRRRWVQTQKSII